MNNIIVNNPLTCTPLTCTPLTCTPLTCTPLTCVSAYYPVKNKHGDKFLQWFKTSLRINCPYVFFSTKAGIELIKTYRTNLPTYYVEYALEDFYTYQYKDKMLTHPIHCPSAELNVIWLEKMFLLDKAHQINPFKSEFFCWVDAGICVYRQTPPPLISFPNLQKVDKLPKDKFIYSMSTPWNSGAVTNTSYYHHISGTYILHRDILIHFTDLYKIYLDKIFTDPLLSKSNLWTDQVVLTHMFKAHPHRFYKLCEGYGIPLIALR